MLGTGSRSCSCLSGSGSTSTSGGSHCRSRRRRRNARSASTDEETEIVRVQLSEVYGSFGRDTRCVFTRPRCGRFPYPSFYEQVWTQARQRAPVASLAQCGYDNASGARQVAPSAINEQPRCTPRAAPPSRGSAQRTTGRDHRAAARPRRRSRDACRRLHRRGTRRSGACLARRAWAGYPFPTGGSLMARPTLTRFSDDGGLSQRRRLASGCR